MAPVQDQGPKADKPVNSRWKITVPDGQLPHSLPAVPKLQFEPTVLKPDRSTLVPGERGKWRIKVSEGHWVTFRDPTLVSRHPISGIVIERERSRSTPEGVLEVPFHALAKPYPTDVNKGADDIYLKGFIAYSKNGTPERMVITHKVVLDGKNEYTPDMGDEESRKARGIKVSDFPEKVPQLKQLERPEVIDLRRKSSPLPASPER